MKRLVAGSIVCAVLLTAVASPSAQMPTYGVTVTVSKNVDPAAFKTYTWTRGGPSPDKMVDAQIVAAVDKQLAALGMTKAATGKGDALVTYYSLRRTDVNLNAKADANGGLPTYPVGTLLVAFLDPGTRKRLVQLRTDKPIDLDRSKADAIINGAVTELFSKYPAKGKK